MENSAPALKEMQLRVLVVDDHPNTATTLARAISQLSPRLEVLAAHSAEDALQMLRDRPVDFLITDMMMTGMNGLELVEKLQSHPAGRPAYIMLVTAYDVPGLKITARRMHVNEIVIKPARPERVCQLISQAIEKFGQEPAENVSETRASWKILIADDLPDNVSLLTRYLGNEGYACITASDGAQALQKARAELPDMVLLDMNMPVKDGFETLQEIRSDPAIGHLPVIVLTAARIEPMDMQMALNMGADDYITKPFDRRELLARIRTRLRVKEVEDQIRRRNRELNLLPEIARELSVPRPLAELGNIILRRTVETLGAFGGQIILFEGQESIQHTYQVVAEENNRFAAKQPDLPALKRYFHEKRQGFAIADTSKDPRWSLSGPPCAMVIVPIFGRADLLGLLALAHEQIRYFKPEHISLLQALGGQAAIAIENTRLISQMETMHKELNTNVLNNLTRPIVDIKKYCDAFKEIGTLNENQKLYIANILKAANIVEEQVRKLQASTRQDLAKYA